ncbi:MAG: MBL fold metallo-hydrolase [Acidimicrobiia bacterium]
MQIDTVFTGDGFTIHRIVVGPMDNNVYLITDSAAGTGLIVDAADSPRDIIALAAHVDVDGVFTTHGHWDHHQAIPQVSDALKVPFMLHPLDAELAGKTPSVETQPGPILVGATQAMILHTPGHTPGSVCLAIEGVVMTGDTLFPGGPGATRFEGSSFTTIIKSIETALFTLPDTTVVLPGHGQPTTIGTERPQLASWIERGW